MRSGEPEPGRHAAEVSDSQLLTMRLIQDGDGDPQPWQEEGELVERDVVGETPSGEEEEV